MTDIKTNSWKAWLLAARPKTLAGASVPVMIGSSMSWKDAAGDFQWIAAILCFLFAFTMQIDANFVNDYFDFKHGNDDDTRLGPRRACAEGWITLHAMRRGLIFTTLLGCVIGSPLIYYGGREMILVGILCIVFCFLYTTTLSYHGWGDILVLVFFGIIPVCLTYYVTMPKDLQTIPADVFLASIACGLVVDTLLIINNYRDRENDKKARKRTLVVRIGATNSEKLYWGLGIIAMLCDIAIFLCDDGNTPWWLRISNALILLFIYGGLHDHTYRKMSSIHQGKKLNTILGNTARNIFFYGVLVSAAMLASSLFGLYP